MFERFYYDDDGTLVDRTIEWSNPYTTTGAYGCEGYLYVSSYLPFNHKYFDITTANDKTGTLTVDIWHDSSWVAAADIIDYTFDGTQAFGQSGSIFFTPTNTSGWMSEDDSSNIAAISTTKVYGAYWMRFGFDSATESACVINYIGSKFCSDSDLYIFYPQFYNTTMLTMFKGAETAKTTWTAQEISASNYIVSDLKGRYIINSKNQIFDTDRFKIACVHKTAEYIFGGMGNSYVEQKVEAKKAYEDAMNGDFFGVDTNADGHMDRSEKTIVMRRMTR